MSPDSAIRERSRQHTKRPPRYNVVVFNDDFTPMDFVTEALENIFHLTRNAAVTVMLDIHKKGKGLLGPYSRDIAMTRCRRLIDAARKEGHPLRAAAEPA